MTLVSINYSGYTAEELETSLLSLDRLYSEGRINKSYFLIRRDRILRAMDRFL